MWFAGSMSSQAWQCCKCESEERRLIMKWHRSIWWVLPDIKVWWNVLPRWGWFWQQFWAPASCYIRSASLRYIQRPRNLSWQHYVCYMIQFFLKKAPHIENQLILEGPIPRSTWSNKKHVGLKIYSDQCNSCRALVLDLVNVGSNCAQDLYLPLR